jgi:hypothetical protein
MRTKTQFKALAVEQLRHELLEMFEDPEGSIEVATKRQLQEFVDEQWDYIDQIKNAPDPEPEVIQTEEETLAEEAIRLTEAAAIQVETAINQGPAHAFEDEATKVLIADPDHEDLSRPNPRTDLYSGALPE